MLLWRENAGRPFWFRVNAFLLFRASLLPLLTRMHIRSGGLASSIMLPPKTACYLLSSECCLLPHGDFHISVAVLNKS